MQIHRYTIAGNSKGYAIYRGPNQGTALEAVEGYENFSECLLKVIDLHEKHGTREEITEIGLADPGNHFPKGAGGLTTLIVELYNSRIRKAELVRGLRGAMEEEAQLTERERARFKEIANS
jgi:hypothetical protein